jgi:hypothetical protein
MIDVTPFIVQLRCVCETIFDVMLNAYISALKASISVSNREGGRPNIDGWDQVLGFAEDALAALRRAESQRMDENVDAADMSVLEGLRLLFERYCLHRSAHSFCHCLLSLSTGAVPMVYNFRHFMTGWDEDKVRKA